MFPRSQAATIHVMNRQPLINISILVAAGAILLATASLATASTRTHRSPATSAVPTPATLAAVRDHVQQWLASAGFKGFRVSEVMAFSNNDYAAITGKNGKPAFELLVATNRSWLMEEPASMMWNTRYGMLGNTNQTFEPIPGMSMLWGGGMMGGGMMGNGMMGSPTSWYSKGTGKVTSLSQAVTVADTWLAKTRPGQTAEKDGRSYPGYFTMDTIRNGKTAGMLSVNASSGAVWYHGWHGTFLSERMFTSG
jgi:hypothetical protein